MPFVVSATLGVLALFAGPAASQHGATNGEWRNYGGDVGSTKYSPLDQITSANFEELEVAWRWRSIDTHLAQREGGGAWFGTATDAFEALAREDPERWDTDLYRSRPGTSLLIATPLFVNGVLYLSTPLYQAAAIDARTGRTLWVYDPKAYESGTPAVIPWRHRGVAYWSNADDARIVWATGDGFLIAVDATAGRPPTSETEVVLISWTGFPERCAVSERCRTFWHCRRSRRPWCCGTRCWSTRR